MKKRSKCEGTRKDYFLTMRVSKEEYELIAKLAKDNGISKSNLIMGIILNTITKEV